MRLYVSGAWAHRHAVRRLMAKLVEAGHTMTYDWTRAGLPPTGPAGKVWLRAMAARELAGIRAADAFVALMDHPTYPYRGTLAELGVALGAGIPVFILTKGVHLQLDATYTRVALWHLGSTTVVSTGKELRTALGRVQTRVVP
jgi:nucleoside 2-deoxyribosyltransferase